MKKRLTRDSFSALRETAIVLDEREQRAVKGGDYWSENGVGYYDSNGNYYWTCTSNDSGGGSYSSGSSGYNSGSNYSSNSGSWISQSTYYNWSGTWPGGWVEGLGYVVADVVVTGSGYNSGSTYAGSGGTVYSLGSFTFTQNGLGTPEQPIGRAIYENWPGNWIGGYVDGLGYVAADVNGYPGTTLPDGYPQFSNPSSSSCSGCPICAQSNEIMKERGYSGRTIGIINAILTVQHILGEHN